MDGHVVFGGRRHGKTVAALHEAYERGVAAERQRCAKIAREWRAALRPGTEARLLGHREAARSIAEAIEEGTKP